MRTTRRRSGRPTVASVELAVELPPHGRSRKGMKMSGSRAALAVEAHEPIFHEAAVSAEPELSRAWTVNDSAAPSGEGRR